MACRKGKLSLPDCTTKHVPNNVDQLTLKYMEMCKMESSTDSDSEVSPRWSDTSTLGCVSSASEHETLRRSLSFTYKSAGRHATYSLFLDPYDGSSEDSDESNTVFISSRQIRQQGKCCGGRLFGRRKRLVTHYPVPLREVVKNGGRDSLLDQQPTINKDGNDVQMKCESDSELWDCQLDTVSSRSDKDGCRFLSGERITESSMHSQTMELELQPNGSSTPRTPGLQTSMEGLNSCFGRSASSCDFRSLFKRKGGLPGVEVELGPRKRQCVTIQDEQEEKENV